MRKTSRAVVDRFRFDQAIARARAEFREDGWLCHRYWRIRPVCME